jgi:hypothetical protein
MIEDPDSNRVRLRGGDEERYAGRMKFAESVLYAWVDVIFQKAFGGISFPVVLDRSHNKRWGRV